MSEPTAIVLMGLMIRRELLRIYHGQLDVLQTSLGNLERAMTKVANELIITGRKLDERR